MKSAYELAMERLAKSDPDSARELSPSQKARIAEIDRVHTAKWAEREIFLRRKLEEALSAGKADDAAQIQRQISGEKAGIEEDREAEKERVRRSRS